MATWTWLIVTLLEGTAVREDDAMRLLVELDNHERQLLTELSLRAILLCQVLRSSEALATLVESDNGALVHHLGNLTVMDSAGLVDLLVLVPRILLKLLVAEAQTTVLLVDLQDDDLNLGTHCCELRRMLHLLGPRQVRDVDKTIDTLLELYEDTEVGEVADLCSVDRADRILLLDILPRILLELLQTERHLALLTVERQDNGLYLVADVEELLS